MTNFQDHNYLVSSQYKDAGNLSARMQLHERYSTNPYGWFRWVFDQFDLPRSAHILELGCGSGRLWLENLYRLPGEWQVTLSDFSYGMLRGCHDSLVDGQDNFKFEVSDAMALPFSPATFDAVIANHMLYHVPNRRQALAEIGQVLKPDGTFYAATNGEQHLFELDQLMMRHISSSEEDLYQGKFNKSFTLENGASQLGLVFSQVKRRNYEDSLLVTEAEPLLAYIISMFPRWGMQGRSSQESLLGKAVHELIEREGSFSIQKSSGMFIARK